MIALGALYGIARRAKPPHDPTSGGHVFDYHPLMLASGLVSLIVIPVAVCVFAFVAPVQDDSDQGWVLGATGLFALLGAVLTWECWRYRLVTEERGLQCHSPWRGLREMAWEDVARLSYNPSMAWFVVQSKTGEKIRVPMLVRGSDAFLNECEMRLGRDMVARVRQT